MDVLAASCIMALNKNYMKAACIQVLQIHTGMMLTLGNKTYVGKGVEAVSGSVQYDVQGNIISDSRKFAPEYY